MSKKRSTPATRSTPAFPGRVPAETVAREKQSRFNPIRGLDPDRLVDAICAYNAGELAPMARIIEAFEQRDDTMTTASRKMRASVVRCPHQVLIAEGVSERDRERAQKHKAALERFWARVRTTSLFARNSRGGFQMLVRQMMAAQSYGFAVHEIVWRPRPDGEIEAQFVAVPLQFFENTTGELRFRRDPSATYYGEEMADGEWLVTSGDGIGIAASVAAMGKRLSFQDWLLFSERCGQPGLHAKTGAKKGSDEWNNLVAAVANFGRDWGIVTDMSTVVESVSLANGGPLPFPELVRLMNQAISALYRGNDLSTISGDSGDVGASLQGEETDLLEQAACETLSETLQEQVERHVIAYEFGDEEPLAYIQISPRAVPDVDKEIQVDQHLVSLGVPLSRNDALERYGRAMADPADGNDAALKQAQPPAGGGFGAPGGSFGLPNEDPAAGMALQRPCKGLQRGLPPSEGENARPEPATPLKRVLAAFRADLGPAAEELKRVLDLPEAEMRAACKDLAGRLPDLLPADPAMAAILAEELAGAFAEAVGEVSHEDTKARSAEALANETDAQGHEHAPAGSSDGGRFVSKEGGSSAGSAPSDPKKDEGEKKEEKPDRNASPTKPKDVTYDPEARNDGQIDFKELSFNRELADTQARKAGYAGVDDMMKQSVNVPQQRIDQLLKGFNGTCKPHEAIAAIRTRATFQAANGETVKLSEYCVRHYVCGERRDRERDAPKIENLCDFPKAVDMMRDPHVSSWHELDGERITQPPFPRKTQTHWSRKDKSGKLLAYAYTDSGLLNGWHFLKPRR